MAEITSTVSYEESGYSYVVSEDGTSVTLTFNPNTFPWLVPAGFSVFRNDMTEVPLSSNVTFKYDGINYQYIITGLTTTVPEFCQFL